MTEEQKKESYATRFKNKNYTNEEIAYLEEIIPNYPPKIAVEMFNKKFNKQKTKQQIIAYRDYHKIKVNYNCDRNKDGTFKKGHIPPRQKGEDYEFITKMGKYKYIYKKIANNKFVLKHRYIWEKHNGKIPKGYDIAFLDGDRTNTNIDNLVLLKHDACISFANRELKSKDREITKTQVQIAELKSKANELKKEII